MICYENDTKHQNRSELANVDYFKVQTVFDRIRLVSHSFEEERPFLVNPIPPSVIVSFWNEMSFCQFLMKMLQSTQKTMYSCMCFILHCKTVFTTIYQVLCLTKKSRFRQFWAYFWNSHYLPINSRPGKYAMKKIQNISIAMNCPMWLILKAKTVFNRIRLVSHGLRKFLK